MSAAPPAPAPTPTYVVIWRESNSPRLRTYVDDDTSRPLATSLANIAPAPDAVITTQADLDSFLTGLHPRAADPSFTAAVTAPLVEDPSAGT